MNTNPLRLRLTTFVAYGCAVFLGMYLSSSYSDFGTKALFIAVPIIALKIARVRSRNTSDLFRFPAEAASGSTHELAERDLDSHSRYIDIISRAS